MNTDDQGDEMQQYNELVVPASASGLDVVVPLLNEAVATMDRLMSLLADAGRTCRNDMTDIPRAEFAALMGIDYQLPLLMDKLRDVDAGMRAAQRAQNSGH